MTNPGFSRGNSPRLLVSVRSPDEARSALEGGAEIIDIKEPRNGSLGKADDDIIGQIVQTVCAVDENRPPTRAVREMSERNGASHRLIEQGIPAASALPLKEDRIPAASALPLKENTGTVLSVALGELRDWQESDSVPQLPAAVDYVKLGFSGCRSVGNWRNRWRAFRRRLMEESPASPDWVAVVYADWQTADAPHPRDILDAATEIPCAAVLIDTYHKTGRSLVDLLSSSELISFAEQVHGLGMPLAVAGSLRVDDLPMLGPLAPQIVAIRTAACLDGQRGGAVCVSAIQNFRDHLVHASSTPLPHSS